MLMRKFIAAGVEVHLECLSLVARCDINSKVSFAHEVQAKCEM